MSTNKAKPDTSSFSGLAVRWSVVVFSTSFDCPSWRFPLPTRVAPWTAPASVVATIGLAPLPALAAALSVTGAATGTALATIASSTRVGWLPVLAVRFRRRTVVYFAKKLAIMQFFKLLENLFIVIYFYSTYGNKPIISHNFYF